MDLKKFFAELQVSDHAKTAQIQTVEYLSAKGFNSEVEYRIDYRDDKIRGFIDIVATKDGKVMAIEFDRKTPRKNQLLNYKVWNVITASSSCGVAGCVIEKGI